MAIYSPVTAFLLLISSALVLDTAIYFRRHEQIYNGRDWDYICNHEPCGNVEAAGVSAKLISFTLKMFSGISLFVQDKDTQVAISCRNV